MMTSWLLLMLFLGPECVFVLASVGKNRAGNWIPQEKLSGNRLQRVATPTPPSFEHRRYVGIRIHCWARALQAMATLASNPQHANESYIASYPGLPSQLFFSTAAKKAVREGLGTRLNEFPCDTILCYWNYPTTNYL